MQVVVEPIETLHIYVVPEKKGRKRSSTLLPLFAAFLCIAGIIGVTVYSALNPVYETLKIPAHFFPLTFKSTEPIVPTGIRNYPATQAHGTLTITNGSVISQTLPAGLIFSGQDGIEVVNDAAVFVPAGSALGYGLAYVSAHPLISGRKGNIAALDINKVEGSSVYIRNLRPFTGGQDAYSVKYVTPQDRYAALDSAREYLAGQVSGIRAILETLCSEQVDGGKMLRVTWVCRFVAYPHLPGFHITRVRLAGRTLVVDVVGTARPRPFPGK